jgi:cytochrome b561
VLVTLAVLHVVAALKHQFIDRDGLLLRMLPWRGR